MTNMEEKSAVIDKIWYNKVINTYKECTRDKPVDYTATRVNNLPNGAKAWMIGQKLLVRKPISMGFFFVALIGW